MLCYHAVSERWPTEIAIDPGRLESQLAPLVKRGYRGDTFTRAVHGPPSGKTLVVTFDDAYRSVIELGMPVLERLGLPGTVFVPTAFAGKERPMSWPGIDHWLRGPHEDELTPMSWPELAELARLGWEIGSHTRTHPRLPDLPDDQLAGELSLSRRECESRLGMPCRSLAYPYGLVDGRVVRAAAEAGFTAAGALPDSLHTPSPLLWPRVGVYRDDDPLRFWAKTSPLIQRLRSNGRFQVPATAWSVARRLRAAGH